MNFYIQLGNSSSKKIRKEENISEISGQLGTEISCSKLSPRVKLGLTHSL